MIIYCFWNSKSVFPVKHTIVAIVSHHPAHAIQLQLPLDALLIPPVADWKQMFLGKCKCSLGNPHALEHPMSTYCSLHSSPTLHACCRRTCILQKDWKCGANSCQWSWCLCYFISPGWRVSPWETVSAEADVNWFFNNEEAQRFLFCYFYACDVILRAHIQCWDYCPRLPLKSCRSSSPLNSCCFRCTS